MIDVEGALGHLTQLACDNKDAKAAVAVRELEANHKYLCREVEEQRSLISELRRDLSQWAELAGLRGTEVDSLRRERDELRLELHRIASFVEPHWKGAGETLTSGWLYEEIVHKLKKYSFEVDDAEDKVEELRRENQILKEDCERLRQYGNRDCIAMAEADDDEATLTPEQQKTLYRENMRLSGKWPSAPIKDKPWYSVYQPEPTWLPAPDSQPADMADAQMVEVRDRKWRCTRYRADQVAWHEMLSECGYRPLYSDSGTPLCSVEGLDERSNFVVTQPDGAVMECDVRPRWTGYRWAPGDSSLQWSHAPETHRRPGDWRDSIMEVMR